MDRRLDPELERERLGARRLVAPRPASRLLSSEGERAHINAWKEDTVNTPSLFNVLFVPLETCVRRDCNKHFYSYTTNRQNYKSLPVKSRNETESLRFKIYIYGIAVENQY